MVISIRQMWIDDATSSYKMCHTRSFPVNIVMVNVGLVIFEVDDIHHIRDHAVRTVCQLESTWPPEEDSLHR